MKHIKKKLYRRKVFVKSLNCKKTFIYSLYRRLVVGIAKCNRELPTVPDDNSFELLNHSRRQVVGIDCLYIDNKSSVKEYIKTFFLKIQFRQQVVNIA